MTEGLLQNKFYPIHTFLYFTMESARPFRIFLFISIVGDSARLVQAWPQKALHFLTKAPLSRAEAVEKKQTLSAGVKRAPILSGMDTAPHPELWTRVAALLGALRLMLRGAVPELFGTIANEARAQLIAATALVRRYLHVLAAEITLPARAVGVNPANSRKTPTRRQSRETLFRLTEEARKSCVSSNAGTSDTPFAQWALMMEAARRLSLVLSNPKKHALRLARLLRRRAEETLRSLPVPTHILRRLPPWTDALLCRLDEAARPHAWAGLNSS